MGRVVGPRRKSETWAMGDEGMGSTEGKGPGGDVKEEREEESEEGLTPKAMRTPITPSKAELEAHELTHYPYREWCIFVCRISRRAGPHMRKTEEETTEETNAAFSTYSMNYC